MAKKRPNLVTGLVSSSASIIEQAQQVEKEITGSVSTKREDPEKNNTALMENNKVEEKEVITEVSDTDIDEQPASDDFSASIDSSFDISIFFSELNEKDIAFKTCLISTKQLAMIKNLATVFDVPMQAITYNIIDYWYKTFKPVIDRERKRRSKDIF